MKRLILDMLIGSELLTYRTEVYFLFVYRFSIEPNGFELSGQGWDYTVSKRHASMVRCSEWLGRSFTLKARVTKAIVFLWWLALPPASGPCKVW